MGRVAAQFFVEVDGIAVGRDLMGTKVDIERDGYWATISIPAAEHAFKFGRVVLSSQDERDKATTVALVDNGGSTVEVRIIGILVKAPSHVTTRSPKRDRGDARLGAVVDKLWGFADEAAFDFVDLVRVQSNQYWMEPNGRYPRVLNTVELLDISTGVPRPFPFKKSSASGKFRVLGRGQILDATKLAQIAHAMHGGARPSPGELFVSEARNISETDQLAAPERSVLVAAMGVEVLTKHVLRAIARPDQLPIVELLLDNPRDWSMSMEGLFRKALPQIAGRDLAHKDLAVRVAKLFTARNAVVHRGERIDAAVAKGHVATAVEAVELLRGLLTASTDPIPIGDASQSGADTSVPLPG